MTLVWYPEENVFFLRGFHGRAPALSNAAALSHWKHLQEPKQEPLLGMSDEWGVCWDCPVSVSSLCLSLITPPSGRRQPGTGGSGDGLGRHAVVCEGGGCRTVGACLGLATCWVCSAVEDGCGPAPGIAPWCVRPAGAQAVPLWPHTGPGLWKGKAHLFTCLPLSSLTWVPQP